MSSAQRYSCLPASAIDTLHCHSSRDRSAQVLTAKAMQGSTRSFPVQHNACAEGTGGLRQLTREPHNACHVLPAGAALGVTPSCGLSLPSFARRVASELLGSFSRFGCGFNRRWQFHLGRFRNAMVAMVQRLDARSFFFHPQLSDSTFSALVLKVCRNRFSCHGQSVAELSHP